MIWLTVDGRGNEALKLVKIGRIEEEKIVFVVRRKVSQLGQIVDFSSFDRQFGRGTTFHPQTKMVGRAARGWHMRRKNYMVES